MLLHSCCGPCSTVVIERLKDNFDVTIFYFNPNIEPKEEYEKRKREQQNVCKFFGVPFIDFDYDNQGWRKFVEGLENEKEGGNRCFKCYRLRLEKTALMAKEKGFQYFGTSLTVSPYKNARKINEIGEELAKQYQVSFLFSDFKKHDGYKKSILMSHEYNLYRQDYCGCSFSKKEREEYLQRKNGN